MRRVAPALLVFLLALAYTVTCLPDEYATLTVLESGLVRVDYSLKVNATSIYDVSLIGTPISELGIIVTDQSGNPLAYDINQTSNTITILALNCTRINISYYTQTITTFSKGVWSLQYNSPIESIVKLPKGSTLISMQPVPLAVSTSDSNLVLEFPSGSVSLSFAYIPQSISQDKTTPQTTPQINKQPASTQNGSSLAPGKPSQTSTQIFSAETIGIALAILLLAGIAMFYLLKRRNGNLSEEDREIIELLKKKGGGMFQSEIGQYVKMPTTTLWRRIKKLQELGYVKVEKVGGKNYVRLLRY
jgi:uncharacterized membrane protein